MYFLLILFFGSLLGIIFMIGRKWVTLQNGEISFREDFVSITGDAYVEEWKNATIKNIKKYSYLGLVGTIRLYIRISNFLKIKYQTVKIELQTMRENRLKRKGIREKEANKFLKTVSEYKNKIGKIKRQIKEEEENSL
jgi:hypothetical protein